jgi:hypothetical protein
MGVAAGLAEDRYDGVDAAWDIPKTEVNHVVESPIV